MLGDGRRNRSGHAALSQGGSALQIDGQGLDVGTPAEYARVYDHFMQFLVGAGSRDVDVRPMMHVADAFLLAERQPCEAFHW